MRSRMRISLGILVGALILIPGASLHAYNQPQPPTNDPADEALLGLIPDGDDEQLITALADLNLYVVDEITELQIVVVAGLKDAGLAAADLDSLPGVDWAEPNSPVFMTDRIPNDPEWANQYGLISIRAPQGWEASTGSRQIVIAVLDTGVDLTHPDLTNKVEPGIDIYNGDDDPQDDNGHGTHSAGLAAASTNNGIGIAGTAWQARILPVKVLNASGGGSYAGVAAGIIWATNNGADVISMSLGGAGFSTTLQDAVQYAYRRGVVMVASAGNTSASDLLYPARFPEVIGVGATDTNDEPAVFNNQGPEMSLVAPGVDILSTDLGGGYRTRTGTSESVPFVAGLAALMLSKNPAMTPARVEQIMQQTALDVGDPGWDPLSGYGLIQMDAALRQVRTPASSAPASLPPLPVIALHGWVAPASEQSELHHWQFEITNPTDQETIGLTFRADVDPALSIDRFTAENGVPRPLDGNTLWVDLPPIAPQQSTLIDIWAWTDINAQDASSCIIGSVSQEVALVCSDQHIEVYGQDYPATLPTTGGHPLVYHEGGWRRTVLLGFLIVIGVSCLMILRQAK